MSKERRLGRGLEALLGRGLQSTEKTAEPEQPAVAKEPFKIPRPIMAPEQPRSLAPAQQANGQDKLDAEVNDSEKKNTTEPKPITTSNSGIGTNNTTVTKSVHTSTPTEEPIVIEQKNSMPALSTVTFENRPEVTPHTEQNKTDTSAIENNIKDPAKPKHEHSNTDLIQVNMALIELNPFQPRKSFDDVSMAELAESISAHGLLQPIVVRRVDDVYQLIAGERRLRAAQKAGWEEVPVRVIETDERGAAELAIVENLQRQDLNALEKAASFKRYLKEHRCTQGQLANRLKIDRSTIANLMRLLELPDEVQKAVADGKISQGHARALLPLGEQREQVAFCKKIQNDGLSVRKTETLVQEMIQKADAEPLSLIGRDGKASKQPKHNEHIASLEQEFRAGLGTKVQLTQGNGGSGKLVIQFKNHEEFNRIKEHILGPNKPQAKAG